MQDYSDKRFLVVDDFNDFLSSVKAMLREMGARDVDTANRGEEAIAMCRQKRYDIILHDYNLGAGKNGQQVLEELLAARLISHQCIFVMVTAEMLPTAVLPEMSAGLGVSESQTGFLVSLWAAVVVVASLPLARWTRRFDRRSVVVWSLIGLAVSVAVTALAPTYPIAVGGRLAGALAVGLLWATTNAYTADLVAAQRTGTLDDVAELAVSWFTRHLRSAGHPARDTAHTRTS